MAIDETLAWLYLAGKGGGGGGGGGDKNAYAKASAPTSSDGQNGDYWFELLAGGPGIESGSLTKKSTTSISGWEFTVTETVKAVGLRGFARSSGTGTLKLGTLSNVLVEKNVNLIENQWVSVALDEPITLTVGEHYLVMIYGNSLSYEPASNVTFSNIVSYVQGRWGSYPGTVDAGNVYGADVALDEIKPWPMLAQYYKSNGAWSIVT